ncbi:hypothetical protein GCM10009838_52770 [Catenulispora subtropica]|uniref:Uncharacterized protein n=1 Tax=Catenulispora subtropica TaxID=450798 RepID=A0ABN2SCM5_9ACTN
MVPNADAVDGFAVCAANVPPSASAMTDNPAARRWRLDIPVDPCLSREPMDPPDDVRERVPRLVRRHPRDWMREVLYGRTLIHGASPTVRTWTSTPQRGDLAWKIVDVYEAVDTRRSVRAFRDRPVPREAPERVLTAASAVA